MSGHSKWANIRHRKQAVDLKKSQQFHKIVKELQAVIADMGNDPKTNPKLRAVLVKAKAINLPKKRIVKILEGKDVDSFQKGNVFWLGAQFAKKVFFLLQFNDYQKSVKINCLQKVISKSKLEILPAVATEHAFFYVIAVSFNFLSEVQLEQILSQFSVHDFVVRNDQTIIYFANMRLLKEFQFFAQKNNIIIAGNTQTYLPKIKIKLDKELERELKLCRQKILAQTECLMIVDNLELNHKES